MSEQDLPLSLQFDAVIIGGGIAGLWLANRLKSAGFSIALLEHNALGSDQTMASQGMIHGGMKYTLSGALSGASESIAEMPQHWRKCLCGEGDVDLRDTRILSDHFFLWSSDSITAKLTTFLASKATRGRADKVSDHHRPPLLRHPDFNGNLYKLTDIVLDVHSLVTNLARNISIHSFLIDWSKAKLIKDGHDNIKIILKQKGRSIEIHAQRFIFSAGKGNADLLSELELSSPAMQLRPLQQVMVKHNHPFEFYGHCLGAETTPRITVSTHKLNEHEKVWYLGGSISEKGADMAADRLIAFAQQELSELIPWVDLSAAEWATLPITRAEPRQPQFTRPDNAFLAQAEGCKNLLVAWPTKLTLVPNLANQAISLLNATRITPLDSEIGKVAATQLRHHLPIPPIAATPWEIAFPPTISAEEMLEQQFAELQKLAEEEEQE